MKPFSDTEIMKDMSEAVVDVAFPDKNYVISEISLLESRNSHTRLMKA